MFKFIAKRFAKTRYVFSQHVGAATNDLNAGLATRQAEEKRDLAASLTKDADTMDARIKEMDEKLDKGFWECENGHEDSVPPPVPQAPGHEITCACGKTMKLVKRDLMTGQEKYESDKERGEAQKMAEDKRAQAKAAEEDAANSDKTAKYFRDLAESNRSVAERVRRL